MFAILHAVFNVLNGKKKIFKSALNSYWNVIWPEIIVERNIPYSIEGEGFIDFNIPDNELFEDQEISDADLANQMQKLN